MSTTLPINNFCIKEATQEDTAVLLEFIQGLAEYERLTHTLMVTEESLQTWLFGDRPVAEAVIGYHHDEPVGFALFFYNFSTFVGKPGLYLEDLFVKPEHRGKGFGEQLLRYVAKLAKERDCGRFEWTVLEWNTPAINFYQKLGATVLDDWRVCRVTSDGITQMAGETV